MVSGDNLYQVVSVGVLTIPLCMFYHSTQLCKFDFGHLGPRIHNSDRGLKSGSRLGLGEDLSNNWKPPKHDFALGMAPDLRI